jgi:hypothetical protein
MSAGVIFARIRAGKDNLHDDIWWDDANVAAPLDTGARVGIVLDAAGAVLVLP